MTKCPIGKECIDDECEWYHPDIGHCAIVIIAEELSNISNYIPEMREALN